MLLAFLIWSSVALLFVGLGIYCHFSKTTVGFFSNVKPIQVTDVKAFNRAISNIWLRFALFLELLGVPFLKVKQNSPYFVVVILGTLLIVMVSVGNYFIVESKYKQR